MQAALLVGSLLLAWGDRGHLLISDAAKNVLAPGCLRDLYEANAQALLQASLAPDAWRQTDAAEAPRHYLDIDIYGNPAAYPQDYNAAVAQLGRNAVLSNGTVPWVVENIHTMLVASFRAMSVTNAVNQSGYLSHYASDAHSPYHSTINYDGQSTGNRGIHLRYEEAMIEAYATAVRQALAANTQLGTAPTNIHGAIFPVLIHGTTLLAGINAVDVMSSGNTTALWNAKGQEATDLMSQSASLIAALWQSAYETAGQPAFPGIASCNGPRPDAGTPEDAAEPEDTGTQEDAAEEDAATPDAAPDAGRRDAGRPDAITPDATTEDAGQPDAAAEDAQSQAADAGPTPPATTACNCNTTNPNTPAVTAAAAAALILLTLMRRRKTF